MEVTASHIYRSPRPQSEGANGNDGIEEVLQKFSWLIPLVTELRAEKGEALPGDPGWSALICVEYADDREPIVSLNMKPAPEPDRRVQAEEGRRQLHPLIPLSSDVPTSYDDVLRYVVIHCAIHEFDRDILYDAHSFWIKVSRSRARQTLQNFQRAALRQIITHLTGHEHLDALGGEVSQAWGTLLFGIKQEIDPAGEEPQVSSDTPGWIAWAERFAT